MLAGRLRPLIGAGQAVNATPCKYFETRSRTEEWAQGGQAVQMRFWDRPLHAMTEAFTAAGFRISVIGEPPFVPEARELFREELSRIPGTRFLSFLFFVLEAN
ncbi:hypothetical protein ACTMTI_39545 [Nonomuraea sp. H19]|uniref:hypothetical protein n=1 Tax=Nonomuraea sp. H19 TaxID=3452206 RepID=UPI003F8963F9